MSSDPALDVDRVSVSYGDLLAVKETSLRLVRGRIVALLGPSGCGKSTLLRAIAGLQPLSAGSIHWNGVDLASLPVHRRHFGFMFQDHALFPHRNVADNISFGLRMAGMSRGHREERVSELLDFVGLEGTGERTVGTLSGGQAQRVALARALATEPDLLLLDEPLGSLDRALRDRLVHEIRSIIKSLGITAIHVTHDHDEAVSVADDLALMEDGAIARMAEVGELLANPGDAHTADALGIDTVWRLRRDGEGRVETPFGSVSVAAQKGRDDDVALLRPDAVEIHAQGRPGVVTAARHRAGVWLVTAELEGGSRLPVVFSHDTRLNTGSRVTLRADLSRLEFLHDPPRPRDL